MTTKSADPTRTLTLRTKFVRNMNNRFRTVMVASKKSVASNDCFGLVSKNKEMNTLLQSIDDLTDRDWVENIKPIEPLALADETDDEKANQYAMWLEVMLSYAVLQKIYGFPWNYGRESMWIDVYVREAYKHGIRWSRQQLKLLPGLVRKLGKNSYVFSTESYSIDLAMLMPIHQTNLKMLIDKARRDLANIVTTTVTQVNRTLTEGLASNMYKTELSRLINSTINKIGAHRGELLAQTEVIRAHHWASIAEYKAAGIVNVKIQAEWHTARDSRVCPECGPMDYEVTQKLWSLDGILGMIPLHPRCRCAAVPHDII